MAEAMYEVPGSRLRQLTDDLQAARERAEEAEKALEAADRLAESVVGWDSHVVLEGLAGKYRSARASLSALPVQKEERLTEEQVVGLLPDPEFTDPPPEGKDG